MVKPTGSRPKPGLPKLQGTIKMPKMNKTKPAIKHKAMGRKG